MSNVSQLDAVQGFLVITRVQNNRVLHKGCTVKPDVSLEWIHCFCFNWEVNPEPKSSLTSARQPAGKLVEFSDLRLSTPMTGQPLVLLEYQDQLGVRSIHQVALTCTGKGRTGLIYFGGYDKGKFSIFRADCIHRVIAL